MLVFGTKVIKTMKPKLYKFYENRVVWLHSSPRFSARKMIGHMDYGDLVIVLSEELRDGPYDNNFSKEKIYSLQILTKDCVGWYCGCMPNLAILNEEL